jgi:hypothetical protein
MAAQAELIIRLTTEGKVEVQGPIDNKLVCYGLLEAGRDAIKEYHDAKAKSAIIPVNGAALTGPALRRM